MKTRLAIIFAALPLLLFVSLACAPKGPKLSKASPHYLPVKLLADSFFRDWRQDDYQGMMKHIDFPEPVNEWDIRRAFLVRIPGREDVFLSPEKCEIDEITVSNALTGTTAEGIPAEGSTAEVVDPKPREGDTLIFDLNYSCEFNLRENFGNLDEAILHPDQHCEVLKALVAATEDPASENLSLVFFNQMISGIRSSDNVARVWKIYPDPADFPETFTVQPYSAWSSWSEMAPGNGAPLLFTWELTIEKGTGGYRMQSPFRPQEISDTRKEYNRIIADNYRYVLRNCPP